MKAVVFFLACKFKEGKIKINLYTLPMFLMLNMKVKDFKTPASLVWQLNNQAIILSSSSEN